MNEQIEQAIKDLETWYQPTTEPKQRAQAMESLAVIFKALRAQQSGGWISVEDRLPNNPLVVMIWNPQEGAEFAYYNSLDGYQCWMGWPERNRISSKITHWQEFSPPNAPLEPKEG